MNDNPFTTPASSTPSLNAEQLKAPSNFSILKNIIIAPQKAFKDIQFNYPVLLPLLSIILLNVLLVFFMFSNIDFQWYMDTIVEQSAGEASNAEQDQVRLGLEMVGPMGMTIFGILGAAIGIAIIFCLFSVYFVITSNINNDGFQFGQWFSFVSWASIPSLLGVFASLIVILISTDGKIAMENLNPLSLNALFFGMDSFVGMGKVLSSIGLSTIWTIVLMVIGYAKWTESNYMKSFMIIVIPYIIFYVITYLIS